MEQKPTANMSTSTLHLPNGQTKTATTLTEATNNYSRRQLSPNTLIIIISCLFLVILIYPWIVAVTLVSFLIGFSCIEHLDKCVKTGIATGRFGSNVESYYKKYINRDEGDSKERSFKEVTADPLRDYLEESEQELEKQKNSLQSQNQQSILLHQAIEKTLSIPARSSSSNRSSPERNKIKVTDSPFKSLSATPSRRVSDDSAAGTGRDFGVSHEFLAQRHENSKLSLSNRSSNVASARSTPSPSIHLSSEINNCLRVDQDFRVDIRMDKSFGRLFTNVINYYISPSWAPYETRRQLKLSLKQLLMDVAERLNKKIFSVKKNGERSDIKAVNLLREKLIPLVLHYVDKALARGVNHCEDPIISCSSKKRITLKIRKFCRQICEHFLTKDDQNCKLWRELCVAVLADGVLLNVIELGKDQLPELLEELVLKYKSSLRPTLLSSTNKSLKLKSPSPVDEPEFVDPLSEAYIEKEPTAEVVLNSPHPLTDPPKPEDNSRIGYDNDAKIPQGSTPTEESPAKSELVPFLLDSFLDPPFNLEKPDPIVSRWRPTLKDIVSETDLLYPLIQYMKHVGGQQSLVYLQGVLDDYPQEGDLYCRRVLELEYLPGFCRSNLFLETMGLSRLDVAQEVGIDPFSMSRRNSGHARSASYGGPSSSLREFLKIEPGVMDGLPLSESSHQNITTISSSVSSDQPANTAGPGPGVEPSLAFKRRPHLEMYIAKFMKSTTKSWKQYYDPLAEQPSESVKRAGTDAKTYEAWNHPEVNSRVRIKATNADVFDGFIDLLTSLIRSNPIVPPLFSGLSRFLKPYLMPVVDSQLENNLPHLLTVDVLVYVVDLIADIFEESEEDKNNDDKNGGTERNPPSSTTSPPPSSGHSLPTQQTMTNQEDVVNLHNSSCTTCDPSLKSTIESFVKFMFECFTLHLIDLDHLVKCCKKNRDYIFLFFVDVLDLLVDEALDE